MTTQELIDYYASLLIVQYLSKPKAYATVQAQVTPIIMDQLPLQVQAAFDIDTAVGQQLDILGKYVGVVREGYANGQPVVLSDSDFRTLMKMVIIKNNSGSSLATIQSLISANFPGQIFVSDNQAMGLNYVLLESLGTSELLDVLVNGGYLPAPMGVEVSVTIVPVHTFPFFGFINYSTTPVVSPFNNYPFYQLTYPWLSYGGVS